MRLDHLLSKETSGETMISSVTSYRSVQSVRSFTLFNLEGTEEFVLTKMDKIWGFSSAGRAPALQAGGQRFDPANLHHFL